MVVFALPPNELVLWTMLLLALALGVYWLVSARRRFLGPRASRDRAMLTRRRAYSDTASRPELPSMARRASMPA